MKDTLRPCQFLKFNGSCGNPPYDGIEPHLAIYNEVILPGSWVCGVPNNELRQSGCGGYERQTAGWYLKPVQEVMLIGND